MGGVTIGAVISAALSPWVSVCLAIGIAVGAAVALHRLRGTTLAAPAAWALASALALAAVEAGLALNPISPFWDSIWRYTAAVGTFCPLMAVLGAKRPQDRGWQWVAVSLWVILLVPAMQAVAARSGSRLELFGAWRLLLAGLVAMGLLNYFITRYAFAACLMAFGQCGLLAPYLYDLPDGLQPARRVVGLAAMFVAVLAVALMRPPHSKMGSTMHPTILQLNERWSAFRDGWGAFWGLRVMQRVNRTAELGGWPLRLEWWNGFVLIGPESGATGSGAIDMQTSSQIQQTLDSLLRRFERLDATAPSPGGRSSC